MPYRVIARPNGGHAGFRRSGRFFSGSEWTVLADEEMTPEIRSEPMLMVDEVPAEAPPAPERRARRGGRRRAER